MFFLLFCPFLRYPLGQQYQKPYPTPFRQSCQRCFCQRCFRQR